MKLYIYLFVSLFFTSNYFGQTSDEVNYQDTVFIRYNKDDTADKLKGTSKNSFFIVS
jgi:hypothetical protein